LILNNQWTHALFTNSKQSTNFSTHQYHEETPEGKKMKIKKS
jgi:hypothetical protein